MNKHICYFLAELSKALNSGNEFCLIKTKYVRSLESLLQLLVKEGVLVSFSYKNGFIEMHFNLNLTNVFKKKIFFFSRPSNVTVLSVSDYLKMRKYRTPELDVFMTHVGWMSGNEVLKKKIGGVLVFRLGL